MPPFVVRPETATQALESLGWTDFRKTESSCIYCKAGDEDGVIHGARFQRDRAPMWGAVREVCNNTRGLTYEEFEAAYLEIDPDAADPTTWPL